MTSVPCSCLAALTLSVKLFDRSEKTNTYTLNKRIQVIVNMSLSLVNHRYEHLWWKIKFYWSWGIVIRNYKSRYTTVSISFGIIWVTLPCILKQKDARVSHYTIVYATVLSSASFLCTNLSIYLLHCFHRVHRLGLIYEGLFWCLLDGCIIHIRHTCYLKRLYTFKRSTTQLYSQLYIYSRTIGIWALTIVE